MNSNFPSPLANRRWLTVIGIALLAVGQSVATGIVAFSTRDIFATLSLETSTASVFAVTSLVLAGITIAVLRVLERTLSEGLGQDFAALVRRKLYQHFSRLSANEILQRRKGSIALRFVGDLSALRQWLSLGVARIVSTAIILPGSVTALWMLNSKFALAVSIPLIITIVITPPLATRLDPFYRRLRSKRACLAADMSERVANAPELSLLGREQTELGRLSKRSIDLKSIAQRTKFASASLRALPEIGLSLAGALLLLTAMLDNLGTANTAAALAVLGIIAQPVREIANISDRRRAWKVAKAKCKNILDLPLIHTGKCIISEEYPISLKFNNVSHKSFKNINFDIKANCSIAISAGHGEGKSTLLKLAAGLEKPDHGQIEINHQPLSQLSTVCRSGSIMFVNADSPILSGSLRRALTMGVTPRPDDKQILDICHQIGLEQVVYRLQGLNGRVSENGRNLSNGERQRLLLARAFFTHNKLLLIDDVDIGLNQSIRQLISRLLDKSNTTVLLCTNDRQLLSAVDRIVTIKNGTIISQNKLALTGSG